VIDGNRVAQVVSLEGTDIGGFMGLPPTGKGFRAPAVFLFELKDHLIVRERRIYDFTGLLLQIGVLKAKPV
jgi:predicted ester cyclase